MRVKDKKGNIFEVYPVGFKDGIRFVRVDNSEVSYLWADLEAYIETKAVPKNRKSMGVKVSIGATASMESSSQTSPQVLGPRTVTQRNRTRQK